MSTDNFRPGVDVDLMEVTRSYPRGPLDLTCAEPYEDADVTGIFCHLSAGHRGDHEGITYVNWPDERP